MELKLSRWNLQKQSQTIKGRWCTRKYLAEVCHYSAKMIDHSFEHARAKGLVRTNPVHKEEEAKIIIDDEFDRVDEQGESQRLEASGLLEDQTSSYRVPQIKGLNLYISVLVLHVTCLNEIACRRQVFYRSITI